VEPNLPAAGDQQTSPLDHLQQNLVFDGNGLHVMLCFTNIYLFYGLFVFQTEVITIHYFTSKGNASTSSFSITCENWRDEGIYPDRSASRDPTLNEPLVYEYVAYIPELGAGGSIYYSSTVPLFRGSKYIGNATFFFTIIAVRIKKNTTNQIEIRIKTTISCTFNL
jgi:hypothetical protein